jgi:mRNA interferase MazF
MERKILRGDVWLVNLDPTIGDEIKKDRPVIVINRNMDIGLDLHVIVPVTKWHEDFSKLFWIIQLPATRKNGLISKSAVNSFQVRCLSGERFIKLLGKISEDEADEIAHGVAFCIGV